MARGKPKAPLKKLPASSFPLLSSFAAPWLRGFFSAECRRPIFLHCERQAGFLKLTRATRQTRNNPIMIARGAKAAGLQVLPSEPSL